MLIPYLLFISAKPLLGSCGRQRTYTRKYIFVFFALNYVGSHSFVFFSYNFFSICFTMDFIYCFDKDKY